jgi:hypothetical protein
VLAVAVGCVGCPKTEFPDCNDPKADIDCVGFPKAVCVCVASDCPKAVAVGCVGCPKADVADGDRPKVDVGATLVAGCPKADWPKAD